MSTHSQESFEQLSLEDLKRYAQRGRLVRAWHGARKCPRRFWWRLLRFWYALKISARSFRGHMSELLSKRHWGADLGPQLQQSAVGHLVEDERTKSRIAGTEWLSTARPWASNTVEVEIFLQGFDWGERYALSRRDIQEPHDVAVASGSPHAIMPVTPEENGQNCTLQGETAQGIPA